jgi:hypothetical protein
MGCTLHCVVNNAEVLQVSVSIADGAIKSDEPEELKALLCDRR